MSKERYIEHRITEVGGFQISDITSDRGGREGQIWVGDADGHSGRWLDRAVALELATAIIVTAELNRERCEHAAALAAVATDIKHQRHEDLAPFPEIVMPTRPRSNFYFFDPVKMLEKHPAVAMDTFLKHTRMTLDPQVTSIAIEAAKRLVALGPTTLTGIINEWRKFPELQDFAAALYDVAAFHAHGMFTAEILPTT